jgi:outer membrane protein OmpA-like peptidoglycan-associated protein
MARRAGVICTLALILAVNANAQTGTTGTSTEQNTATTQTPSPAEETRPATTTFFGDTGLWFVPIAEVLPHGKVSVSGYRRGTNYLQGFANVGDFAGTFGVGLGNRAEIFGSFLVDTRIERDLRPIFINDENVGGILDRYPQANEGWEGDQIGDFYVGAKVNFLSEFRQNPAAVGLRGLIKIPTGNEDAGASTGKSDFAIDFIASKEAGQKVDIAGFAGYEWRGEPDYLDAPSSAFRWGAGLGFPSRSRLRGNLEIHGFLPNQDTVTITGSPIIGFDGSIAPTVSATQNLTYTTATVTWQGRGGFFIGGGVSWNVPMKNRDDYRTDEGAFGDYVDWQVRIGYHPGVRVYVPPPPPEPPPPAPEHILTVEAECNPCSVEVGRSSTVTATANSSISCAVTYRWTAPSGTFANATERSTLWTAPNQEGTVPVTVTVTCPTDNKTASDTVNIQVTRPPVKQYSFEDVHFDFDRYSLRPEATRVLDEAIEAMKQDNTLRLTVEGHTCNIGTAEYNLALGDRRANSVREYLTSRGVAADRLNTISYGEERPKHDNAREETRRLNRRAALVVRLQP